MNKPIKHKACTCENCGKFTTNLKWGMCQSCRPHMGATDTRINGHKKSLRMIGDMIVDVNPARSPMILMHAVGSMI